MNIPDQFAAKLLDDLRPREREALGLRYLDQFAIPDVAELLAIKPDSASGHITKGLKAVAKIIGATRNDAEALLDAIGETHARRNAKRTVRLEHRGDGATVGILPHRQIMGGAIRGAHETAEISAFFLMDVDGQSLSVAAARRWYLDAPLALGLALRRQVLAAKGIKEASVFDQEATTYFFPVGYGAAELYYETNFLHQPLTLPLPPGRTLMEHLPPRPEIDRDQRSTLVPDTWPLRVLDLGEYRPKYDEDLALDAEESLRKR